MLNLWLQILWTFTKIGILGFGGGPSFIPLIQEEVVAKRGWLTDEEFVDTLAMSNTLPGPITTKIAAYTGWKIAGVPGVVLGLLGLVGPSMILIILFISFVFGLKDQPRMQGVLRGIRPAVVALLAWTVWDIAPKAVKTMPQGILVIVTFVAMVLFNIHPGVAIVVAALVGFLFFA